MFDIFKSEVKEDKTIVNYSINEAGLKHLKESLAKYSFDYYSGYDLQQFDADIAYLTGIADTVVKGSEMHRIISKMSTLKYALHASLLITEEYHND